MAVDTTHIYTNISSGLPNVGVGEWVYLEGNPEDTAVTEWAWTLTVPINSRSALNETDRPVVKFSPDITGTFRVTLQITTAEGRSEAVRIAINSANYVGVGGIVGNPQIPQCAFCHREGKADEWAETRHATAFSRRYDGEAGSHFSQNCLSCHTTGYATDADNLGFDDRARQEGWTFVDSAHGGLVPGSWDSMKVHYPLTARMANIQCEVCHGPGSAHTGQKEDNRIALTMDVGVCAKCHDSGTYHYRPYQWYASKHSHPIEEERPGCSDCHSGVGFLDQLAGVPDSVAHIEYVPIACATCHDPHSATNDHQIRTIAPFRLMNGIVTNIGYGNLCVNCHHSRSNAVTAARGSITNRYGPHHGPQGDMLKGTNAFTFGQEPVSSPHAAFVDNGCVGCHMAPSHAREDDPNSFYEMGEHTFAMKTKDGKEHFEACVRCHIGITSFFDIMADDDYDGDGTTECVKTEVEGLLENLATALPHDQRGAPVFANWLSDNQRQALWNYIFVKEDKSSGMHNAAYTIQILRAALGADLGVATLDENVPAEFALNKPYPNPFNPVTSLTYAVARDGMVSLKVFDMAGREVTVLFSGEQKAGSYMVPVNLMGKSSGVYFVRMEAAEFSATQKLVLVK